MPTPASPAGTWCNTNLKRKKTHKRIGTSAPRQDLLPRRLDANSVQGLEQGLLQARTCILWRKRR